MRSVTSAQMRELDALATSEFAIPSAELMRRAGQGVASIVQDIVERGRFGDVFIQVIAGRGNNGGDAFVAAQQLHEKEFDVEVLLAASVDAIRGDALLHLSKMRSAGVPLRELPTKEDWEDALREADPGHVIVDGILGIGVSGPPRGPAAAAIHYINSVARSCLVVSIDVPSGLNADTGEAIGETVVADFTLAIGMPKVGLLAPSAIPYVGCLDVIGIGIPSDLARNYPPSRELITGWEAAQQIPRRPGDAHKGMFGHLLVIGGSLGMAGAPAMAARAALRSGVGLVSALVPRAIYPVVAGATLEAMTHPGVDTEAGSLGIASWEAWRDRLAGFKAVVAGPGMTRHADTAQWVRSLLTECRQPLLLDADALNVLEGNAALLARAKGPVVITPHPGEMARLLGCSTEDVQSDRERAAREAARITKAVVVLKGAGTIVAREGDPLNFNLTGNAGMATGGTGDVLAGIIGGLMAQGSLPFDAARIGVFAHGRAGDDAALRLSQTGMTACDLIEELPHVFKDLGCR